MTHSAVVNSERRTKLDLIDSVIVLAISTAMVVFLLWSSSKFLNQETFERLPDFITDTYSAFWTTGIAGGAGVGGAILKHILEKQTPDIDYLKVVLVTVSLLLCFFVGLIFFSIYISGGRDRNLAPPNATIIDFNDTGKPKSFVLATPPQVPVRVNIKGSFVIGRGMTTVNIDSWEINMPPHFSGEAFRLNLFAVAFCRVGHNDPLASPFTPSFAGPKNSMYIDISGGHYIYDLPGLSFEIPNPDDAKRGSHFICSYFANQYGPALISF